MTKDIYICHGCDYYKTASPPCIAICPGIEPDACILGETDPQRVPEWRPLTDEEKDEVRITLF